jgi:glycosyltransferase involved in cell wall biosynthesis
LRDVVVSYPGVMQHAQQIALAFHEVGALDVLVTSFAPDPRGLAMRSITKSSVRVGPKLKRRQISEIPYGHVEDIAVGEAIRLLAAAAIRDPRVVDTLWDGSSQRFDRLVAKRHGRRASIDAIHAFEYTALRTFEEGKRAGKLCVLHLPSLDSRRFRELQRQQLAEWPELADPNHSYFEKRFERRYARRCQERELADIIVCNSQLTAQSHISAGVDSGKVVVTPLGGPETIGQADLEYRRTQLPLKVIWAGPFSLRKGAHHFMAAWRLLNAGQRAEAHVFGSMNLPKGAMPAVPDSMQFHGSVSQQDLFTAFQQADVLVFPTLSDGFGMVVTEALSRGLPVITTKEAGASDLIVPGVNGLIAPPADPKALAQTLEWCLDNREALQAMKLQALRSAESVQWSNFRERVRELTSRPSFIDSNRKRLSEQGG